MRDPRKEPSKSIDWKQTHHNAIQNLKAALLPCHYRALYEQSVSFRETETYSAKTDPCEKFRQYYAEHRRESIILVPNSDGLLALRSWFPQKTQLSLLSPGPLEIHGDCDIAYDAGYEMAKREPHMKDWFGDADSADRAKRRKRALSVEAHVKRWFRNMYGEFYKPPYNEGRYEQPCSHDFRLEPPGEEMFLDVKSASYLDDGQKVSPVRNPKTAILYLFADWRDDQVTELYGLASGQWIRQNADRSGSLYHVHYNLPFPIRCLLVKLNMARVGMEYNQMLASVLNS